ncbi:hypothetical protein VNO78_15611 [Psophocarpus tetragonolobus]|uniref:Uncharacterized protein n=1 Tax=Psophocarpus tetragonolobus TaxID=3891 RepID=A0AAN9XJX7_PSOTE
MRQRSSLLHERSFPSSAMDWFSIGKRTKPLGGPFPKAEFLKAEVFNQMALSKLFTALCIVDEFKVFIDKIKLRDNLVKQVIHLLPIQKPPPLQEHKGKDDDSTLMKFNSIDPFVSYTGVGGECPTSSLMQTFICGPHNPQLPSKELESNVCI